MRPIKFPEANAVIPKSQPEHLYLPVWVEGDNIVSCFRPSFLERVKIMFTGKVWVWIGGKYQPPIGIYGYCPLKKNDQHTNDERINQ